MLKQQTLEQQVPLKWFIRCYIDLSEVFDAVGKMFLFGFDDVLDPCTDIPHRLILSPLHFVLHIKHTILLCNGSF